MVQADPSHLRQVFVNLMTNAAKFTTDGDIHIRIEQNEPDSIELSVTDTGSGIPECELNRIFLRFRQADNTSTRTHGGLGLGLAICRELMEAMKGALTVKSEVGVGSTFTIHCPAVHR